ncbi:FHA domain-containing protein [Sorangium cellulosum]|uniref:FHA domain-containing protein n=1 Tax=Sorangium cellulosum TaxID=56 RepID=UPI0009B80C69|nr:FHA domain-containing protein [Sorangium cellulosum]
MTRNCPRCGTSRPPSATQCDCGHEFRELQGYRVAVLYAPADEPYMSQLSKHLAPLAREGVNVWHAGDIAPGSNHSAETNLHIDTDDVLIILASADYVASDDCYSRQLYDALLNRNKIIISVILRPCDWLRTPIASRDIYCSSRKGPAIISKLANPDDAWIEVANHVRKRLGEERTYEPWYSSPSGNISRAERLSSEKYAILENTSQNGTRVYRLGEFNTIGRSIKNNIAIVHPSVSRQHCIISMRTRAYDPIVSADRDGTGYFLHDLNSLHGTTINGCPVNVFNGGIFHGLRNGDHLRVGDIEMRFLLVD